MVPIIDNKVQTMKGRDTSGPILSGPQARQQSLSSQNLTIVERLEKLEGEVQYQSEQLQQVTDYHYTSNTSLESIMHMMAIQVGVDMQIFLAVPPYLGQPLAV